MAPTLRPYQRQLVRDLYDRLDAGYNRIAIIAGTGAGKTIISGQICADAVADHCRMLFLVHLDVLVGQTAEKMAAFGIPCGFIKAGYPEDPTAPVQIGSVQTMAKRRWWEQWEADMVFYDEAHLTLFSKVGQRVLYKTHNYAIHLAMTATPERLGHDQLGEHMETFVAAPLPAELQAMGFLAQMRYFALPPDSCADVSAVRTVKGDYDNRGLRNACDRPELVDKIVAEWQRLTPGKRTIAFCVDIDHARHVAQAFQAVGVAAEVVAGETSRRDRRDLYDRLRSGELLVLTSCNVISIGFDEPSVEVGLLLRPTQSSALHIQQIGRVMRISPQTGKRCGIILDQAGNLERLGYPEDITGYELPLRRQPKDRKKGALQEKVCPDCGQMQPSFVVQCSCGYSWAQDKPAIAADLVEMYSSAQAHQIQDVGILKAIFHQIRRRTFFAGYSINLAADQFLAHTGRSPQADWYYGSIFGAPPPPEAEPAFWDYLSQCARRDGLGMDWMTVEFTREMGYPPRYKPHEIGRSLSPHGMA